MERNHFDLRKETKPFSSPRTNIIELRKQLHNCKSIIDLGCGKSSNLRFLNTDIYLYGLDAFEQDIDIAKNNKIHNEYILDTIMNIDKYFSAKSVDACVALDVIEHLSKEGGLIFLNKIENIAKEKVIIFTPNGFLPQESTEKGDFQKHLSGWGLKEMRQRGYSVYGMDGLKILRGEYHALKYKPAYLWVLVSWLSQKIWCKYHPNSAAALLCIKEL